MYTSRYCVVKKASYIIVMFVEVMHFLFQKLTNDTSMQRET